MSSSPYQSAASLLNDHLQKKRGLKSLAFDPSRPKRARIDKSAYATVCKTVQHLPVINELLDADGGRLRRAIGFDSIRNTGMAYVLIFELLFSKYRSIRGGGKIKRLIAGQERALRAAAEEYRRRNPGSGVGADVRFPRYVRVNTLACDVSRVASSIRDGRSPGGESDGAGATEAREPQMYLDAHVPNLLVLPPSSSSWLNSEDDLVKSGKAVLQDKSSCFSALVLAEGLGATTTGHGPCDYIDACAAPGNKTSHLAALVRQAINAGEDPGDGKTRKDTKKKKGKSNAKPKSTIYAFERNSARFEILQQRMELLVPKSSASEVAVSPVHGDFLKSDPAEFENVRAILLDPSCSGSGIVNSPDRFEGDEKGAGEAERRVQSLANFQLTILKHAMSFPNAERIVYSTCSVHDRENEMVVSTALEEYAAYAEEEGVEDGDKWVLTAPVCLEHWKRRGRAVAGLTEDQAGCLVRCDGLDGDETNGFFVSLFVRKRLVETKGPREVIEESNGMAVYDGEFAPRSDSDSNGAEPEADANEDAGAPPPLGAKGKDPPTIKNKSEAARGRDKGGPKVATKDPSKSAKKKGKKLAWRKRQAQQKEERLLAKKAKGGEA